MTIVGSTSIPISSRCITLTLLFFICIACSPGGVDGSLGESESAAALGGERNREAETYHLLVSSNLLEAQAVLHQLQCNGDFAAVRDVARAWSDTEKPETGAGSAIKDPYIRTLAANCLIESSQYTTSIRAARASAAQYLREAMGDQRLVRIAIVAIMPAASPSDISRIVDIAVANPDIAATAATALSESCDPEAVLGISTLRKKYAGSSVGSEIEKFVASAAYRDQVTHCDRGPPVPTSLPRISQSYDTVITSMPIDAEVLDRYLRSSSVAEARDALRNHVNCSALDEKLLKVIRYAWHEHAVPGSSMALRDPGVQAEVAKCLVEATSSADADRPDVVKWLRSNIDNNNLLAALACAIGLIGNGDPTDVDRIVRFALRNPAVTSFLIEYLAKKCGSSSDSIVTRMEGQSDNSDRRRKIQQIYERSGEWRRENCRE